MRHRVDVFVSVALVTLFAGAAVGQPDLPAPTQPPSGSPGTTATPPRIEILPLDKEESFMVAGELRLQIKLVNGSPTSDIEVKEVLVSVPERLGVEWSGKNQPDGRIGLLPDSETLEMHQPGQVSPPYLLRASPKHWRALYGEVWSVLLHRPATRTVSVTATYRTLDSPDAPYVAMSTELPVRIDANPLAMYAGALLGATLGTILLMSFGKTSELSSLMRLGRAAVASAIVLLAAQATTKTDLPITIEVHDFFGGVILGLLADSIATALRDRIIGPPSAEPEEASPLTPASSKPHAA